MPVMLWILIMVLLTILQGMLFEAWQNSVTGRDAFKDYLDDGNQQMYRAYNTRVWAVVIIMAIVAITMAYLTYWMFFQGR